MILVTGATGNFGKATIEFLIEKGFQPSEIIGFVRDRNKGMDLLEKGVELRQGDYRDHSSLLKAFHGIEKILLISSSDMVDRTLQHANVINAAVSVGVNYLAYTSIDRWNNDRSFIPEITASHRETEDILIKSGLTYTILRNTIYADGLPGFIGNGMNQNEVNLPAGNGMVPFATRLNMAEAAANIMLSDLHNNKVYRISGDTMYSFSDIANILSEITGKEINYTSGSRVQFIERRIREGLPGPYAEILASFAEAFEKGEFQTTRSDLPTLLDHKPVSLKEFLASVYSK
jgi:NAD(P)H dehydrogenase (quinone)